MLDCIVCSLKSVKEEMYMYCLLESLEGHLDSVHVGRDSYTSPSETKHTSPPDFN